MIGAHARLELQTGPCGKVGYATKNRRVRTGMDGIVIPRRATVQAERIEGFTNEFVSRGDREETRVEYPTS
jgi:hypothetical protein